MVADKEIVSDRLSRIRKYVRDLERFAEISEADFLKNTERQYAVLHALQLAIEAAIEVGTHICAADGLGVPSTYAETFDHLEKEQVVDAQLATDLRAMARFRNRIVHFYWDVDGAQVYEILTGRLKDFGKYVRAVEAYLA